MDERRVRRGGSGSTPKSEPVVRITTAAPSANRDIAARQRRYVMSMAVRTVCVAGAVLVGPGWFRWVLMAGAVFLPYVAVVFANATNRKSESFVLPDATPGRPELPPNRPGAGARDERLGGSEAS